MECKRDFCGAVAISRTAMLCSVTAVLSWVTLPLPVSPVPITGQTLGVMLTGLIMSPKDALLSQVAYLLAGTIGLPVFSGGSSGIGVVLGPTGGYLMGFIPGAALISIMMRLALKRVELKSRSARVGVAILCALVGGVLIVDVFGVIRLATFTGLSIPNAVSIGVLPYLPGDVLKCTAAAVVWEGLNRRKLI